MAVTDLNESLVSGSLEGVAATNAATSAPSSSTDGFNTGRFPTVRTLLAYTAQVSACVVQLWVRDRNDGVWYKGLKTGDTGQLALAPGGASVVNEARDWTVGRNQEIFFQLSTVTVTGGTVALRIQGVDPGGYRS